MTTAIVKRAVTAPRDPQNKLVIDQLRVAVLELSGSLGSQAQRAVRVCELVDAGIMEFKADGTVGRPGNTLAYELDQNLRLTGKNPRIIAEMSSAPHSVRLMFQSSVPNQLTSVGAIPNGTSTIAQFQSYNSQDPDNAGAIQLRMDTTEAVIHSIANGTGVLRDLVFKFQNSERARLDTAGNLTIAGAAVALSWTGKNVGTSLSARNSSGVNALDFGNGFATDVDGVGWMYNRANADIVFGTNNTERGRILAGGALSWSGNIITPANLVAGSIGPSFANVGFQYVWNVVQVGVGRNEYINNNDGGSGGHVFYSRTNTSLAPIPHLYLTPDGNVYPRTNGGNFWAGAPYLRQPRVFVGAADPGAAAEDGDLWVWTGFVRYRAGGAWTTAAT